MTPLPEGESDPRFDTLIIGGGQAGLAVGYHLAKRGRTFLILDANARIGDAWRNRWDSLRVFTPARYDGLPGKPFPGPAHAFPSKDEVADYLEAYAARFSLPVRTGVRVDRVSRLGDRFLVTAGNQRFEADNIVVAMGSYQNLWTPSFAPELDPGIIQLHSSQYRNPTQLQDGGVLVVGAGNSGAEIALDVAGVHPTWLSGPERHQFPFDVDGAAARFVFLPLMFRFIGHRVLTVDTPIGRKMRPKINPPGSASGPGKTQEHRGRRDHPRTPDGGRTGWAPDAGGPAGPRRGQRGLVHGVSSQLRLDRSSGRIPGRGTGALPGDRRQRARLVLRRPVLPLRAVLRIPARHRPRRRTHRQAHRQAHRLARARRCADVGLTMTRVLTAWRASNLPLPAPHAVGIAAGIGLHHRRPWTLPGPRWAHQLIGLPLIAAAAQLTARSMAAASEVQLAFPDRLVQTGPYATSRNPMYLAWTLLHLGVGIAHGSIWIVATTPAAVGWVHSAVRGEERTLSAQFGDEFERYRAAVPRYLRRPQRSPFHPRRSVRTVARTADHTMTTRKA